jgi:hypothetical protein
VLLVGRVSGTYWGGDASSRNQGTVRNYGCDSILLFHAEQPRFDRMSGFGATAKEGACLVQKLCPLARKHQPRPTLASPRWIDYSG